MNTKRSLIGSAFAFLLATSCCWLPWLAIGIGSATGAAALFSGLEKMSGIFMFIGAGMLGWSGYQFLQNKKEMEVQLLSTLTCPKCNFVKEETMPTNACQFFYECESCKTVLKPKQGDCCVYCSYGTVPCPPIQTGKDCC